MWTRASGRITNGNTSIVDVLGGIARRFSAEVTSLIEGVRFQLFDRHRALPDDAIAQG
jgi:hypothetical protein